MRVVVTRQVPRRFALRAMQTLWESGYTSRPSLGVPADECIGLDFWTTLTTPPAPLLPAELSMFAGEVDDRLRQVYDSTTASGRCWTEADHSPRDTENEMEYRA